MKFVNLKLLMAGLAGIAALTQAQTPPKVGAINIQAAMTGTKEGQKAAQELEQKLLPRKKAIDAKAAAVRDLQDRLQRGGAAMSESAKADLTRQIDERTKSYNRDMEDAQAELSDDNRRLIQEMTTKMTKVLDDYAVANNFSVIFDVSNPNTPVLYTSNMVDITREIITLYDKAHPPGGGPAPAAPAAPKPAATPKKQP